MRRVRSLAAAIIAAAGLTLVAAAAQAAPAGGTAGEIRTVAGDGTLIEPVRHRCYRYRGRWRCPPHRYRRYYGPGIYFNFGPRRYYHGHRHYRRHGHHRRWHR